MQTKTFLLSALVVAFMAGSNAQDIDCPPGQLSVSVEGGETGCAAIPICVGGMPKGNCPSGSICGIVKSGVPGCIVDNSTPSTSKPPAPAPSSPPSPPSDKTCAALACELPDFSTLCAAVKAADLAGALSGNTVFAPTNEAFTAAKITDLGAIPKDALTAVLAYHVVPGSVFAKDLKDQLRVKTAGGPNVTIALTDAGAYVNQAEIVKPDVQASDCVIHVINAVLNPPTPAGDAVQQLVAQKEVSVKTLIEVATKLEVAPIIANAPAVTLLAPIDSAFAAIESVVATLTPEQIKGVLSYHAYPAVVFSGPLVDGQKLKSLGGAEVVVSKNSTGVFFNNAKVVLADDTADNGVVHYIDQVLIPPSA